MDFFIITAIIVAIIPVIGMLLVRNRRYKALATKGRKYASFVMSAVLFSFVCNLCVGNGVGVRIMLDTMLAVTALSVLTNPILKGKLKWRVARCLIILEVILSLYYVLCSLGIIRLLPDAVCEGFMLSLILINICFFVYVVWLRIRSVKDIMSFCTVWAWLTFAVDVVYLLMIVAVYALRSLTLSCMIMNLVTFVMMSGLMFAYSIRIISDSAFALLVNHERLIVESMKISLVEASGVQREESAYREVFERIKRYFETEKPYLNHKLTINDVVLEVFSNKVYISRAISDFTGRNFCQYVNYHRIKHAMELFRRNTNLKISELWPLSGFNSIVSFNMAFRLFVNESPSEWCRKEKKRQKSK